MRRRVHDLEVQLAYMQRDLRLREEENERLREEAGGYRNQLYEREHPGRRSLLLCVRRGESWLANV